MKHLKHLKHYCEVNVDLFATSPDDPQYRPCGLPAIAKDGFEVWMCAEHWDEHDARFNKSLEENMEEL